MNLNLKNIALPYDNWEISQEDVAILPIDQDWIRRYFKESKSWLDLVATNNHSLDLTNNKHK